MAGRRKPRTLLIDGDIFFYKSAVVSQGSVEFDPGTKTSWADQDACFALFDGMVQAALRKSHFEAFYICLSDHHSSFRKELVAPSYKQSRNGFEKPKLLQQVEDYATDKYQTLSFPRLEADDVIGIHATSGEHMFPVILSADKDLKQIPGEHLIDGQITPITAEEGHHWHMEQTLTGDPTDGYAGCPGIGKKRATTILDSPPETWWSAIVDTYAAKGLDEDYALSQARLAYILQARSYRASDHKIKLWKPA